MSCWSLRLSCRNDIIELQWCLLEYNARYLLSSRGDIVDAHPLSTRSLLSTGKHWQLRHLPRWIKLHVRIDIELGAVCNRVVLDCWLIVYEL